MSKEVSSVKKLIFQHETFIKKQFEESNLKSLASKKNQLEFKQLKEKQSYKITDAREILDLLRTKAPDFLKQIDQNQLINKPLRIIHRGSVNQNIVLYSTELSQGTLLSCICGGSLHAFFSSEEKEQMVKCLIEKYGADPNLSFDSMRVSVPIIASIFLKNSPNLIQILVKNGADLKNVKILDYCFLSEPHLKNFFYENINPNSNLFKGDHILPILSQIYQDYQSQIAQKTPALQKTIPTISFPVLTIISQYAMDLLAFLGEYTQIPSMGSHIDSHNYLEGIEHYIDLFIKNQYTILDYIQKGHYRNMKFN